MTIRRASVILPSTRLDELPTHLTGHEAADLLAAWTALWHPALIAATGSLPRWHSADNPPDPSELEGELILLPTASRQRLASDWCDRYRTASPPNPPLVEARPSRQVTLAAALAAASLDPNLVSAESAADFLALGHAHLQVESLTGAMRYTSVLDTDQFESATVAAAKATVAGNQPLAQEELTRAFDLLADARNHVYAVDFYLVDVTLLARSTLGEALRTKLASGSPTSVLLTGELLEQMASEQPESVSELRRAISAGSACAIGGMFQGGRSAFASPEKLLAELENGQQAARRHLGREFEVFAQFESNFSPRLPEILVGSGFRGALHAVFDGGRLPKADQCKTWWGPGDGVAIQALAATPLDVARPETWLRLAERIGDTIAHHHVATILLAGWPGTACEYFDDLRRAARYGAVLGKMVTLEEYFAITREPDEWTNFYPREYPSSGDYGTNPISSRIESYRRDVFDVSERLGTGLAKSVGLERVGSPESAAGCSVSINPWSFAQPQYVGCYLLEPWGATGTASAGRDQPLAEPVAHEPSESLLLPEVPGCGYATFAAAATMPTAPLADNRILRNERFEVTISETTGGIQSLRMHRDRSTRISQRLVFHDSRAAGASQMLAERIEISRNDAVIGEITSQGRLLNAAGELLGGFKQTVRVARAAPAVILDIELDPQRLPSGEIWRSYFASRMAWSDDAISFRRGVEWIAGETNRERIESPEWVEIDDGIGTLACFGLGLPFHRQAAPNLLDTLLLVDSESRRRFQFALNIDDAQPLVTALGLLTADRMFVASLSAAPNSPTGWFLHISAKNVLLTHIEPLSTSQSGVRMRILETQGRDTHTTLAAFRPFHAARITDFRSQPAGVLSVADGRVEVDIGPHRWIQLEAEW